MRNGKEHFVECGSLSNCRRQSRISLTRLPGLRPREDICTRFKVLTEKYFTLT